VEASAVAHDLEPNQQAAFLEGTEEIERDSSRLNGLALPAARPERWRYELIAVREPMRTRSRSPKKKSPIRGATQV
jgi:hypothetical protein